MPNKMAQARAKRNRHIAKRPPGHQSFKRFWRKCSLTKAPRRYRRMGAKELWHITKRKSPK